jgi:hypothetical protein
VQAEYGWTRQHIYQHVTPGELIIWSECIARRRALEDARAVEVQAMAVAGARNGPKAYRAMRKAVKALRERAGQPRQQSGWMKVVQALGLKQVE